MSTIVDQEEFVSRDAGGLRWRSWPARENPLRAALTVAALCVLGLTIGWLTRQTVLAWFGAGTMAISMWRFFLPVDFEFGVRGVDQVVLGRRRHRPWASIHAYKTCLDGVLLLPCRDFCLMDMLFSLYLPWPGHRGEVLAQLREHLGEPLEELPNERAAVIDEPLRDSAT